MMTIRMLAAQLLTSLKSRRAPKFEGATEDWSPAAEVAQVERQPGAEPAPDFDMHVWTVDVHGALNTLMDDFHADVEHIWGRFYDWLGIDARTRMELAGVRA